MKTTHVSAMEVILKGISLERIWKLKIRLQRISRSFWVHYVIRQFMRMYSMSKFLKIYFFQLASHPTLQICTILFIREIFDSIFIPFVPFIKINHHTFRNFFISTFFLNVYAYFSFIVFVLFAFFPFKFLHLRIK